MRVEFGTMKEIGFAVGDLLDGVELPEGSIVLVGSVSDLVMSTIPKRKHKRSDIEANYRNETKTF